MKSYLKQHKKTLLWFVIAIAVIFITSLTQSLIQNAGGSITVIDLRNATNTGTISRKIGTVDENDVETISYVDEELEGEVVSGILFKPNAATADNPRPAVVLTHGYLNNRELQLPFAIELARRGYVVLTVDREGHGNYNNVDNASALTATKGLYESAKYVYNLDYVDKDKIGITGHSMGGFTTAMALVSDNADSYSTSGSTKTYNLGIVKAALIQGWSSFYGAGSEVDVGLLKASDDEFFFNSTDSNGNATISREFLHSTGAASFVGVSYATGEEINIENATPYVNGATVEYTSGVAIDGTFRAIYEADEIHPLNHWSIPSTKHLIDFFYASFGTPDGVSTIASSNQIWWVKEGFSLIGMIALFSLIFPAVSLLLTIPFFSSLKFRIRKKVTEEGVLMVTREEVTAELIEGEKKPVKKWYEHLFYWLPPIGCALWAGFSIRPWVTDWADRWFPNTQLYPQDTTNWVALWTMCCGLFAIAITLCVYIIRYIINKVLISKGKEPITNDNPFATAKVSGVRNALKTIILALVVVFGFYLIVFTNWAAFKVDFRFWTLTIKVFNVPEMLPTILRYLPFFLVFYVLNGICNQTYRAKNLPEWLTIAVNACFNCVGIFLVVMIQYGTFKSTGVLWQSDMALGYIVVFPVIPILIIATIISRWLYKKTGNVWLGSLINALIFTTMTVSGTAASYAYILG